jgi:hypothetical protein
MMVAPLVPEDKIPDLAEKIDSRAMFEVLLSMHLQGFLSNGSGVTPETRSFLDRLAKDFLVESAYERPYDFEPLHWVITGNGRRVIRHLEERIEKQRLAAEDAPPNTEGKWLP